MTADRKCYTAASGFIDISDYMMCHHFIFVVFFFLGGEDDNGELICELMSSFLHDVP